MKHRLIKLLLFILMCTILSFTAFAVTELEARAGMLGCQIDFHKAVLNSVASKVPQAANLSTLANKLQSDKNQVNALANAGNASVFRQFVNSTLRPDMKSSNRELQNARRNFKVWNVTKETKKALQNASKEARGVFTGCVKENALKHAQVKVNKYSKRLDDAQVKVGNLSSKNVSTAELTGIINQARAQIITPLQNAVNSGDGAQAQAALKQYCLYNDCNNGTNFHFNAKFQQARLSALLAYVKPRADAANLSANVSAIQAKVDQSKAALNAIGNAHATKAQIDGVWGPLKQAVKDFRQLLKDIRKAGK